MSTQPVVVPHLCVVSICCVCWQSVCMHILIFSSVKKPANIQEVDFSPPVLLLLLYLFSKMYRPLHQAVCGECRAARRGEETCWWKARRDSEQNVPAVLGWPQVQAGHRHCSRDTQAGRLRENHPWIGMCKRQEVHVASPYQVWIQKWSARSVLLWNSSCFVWSE